MRFLVKLVRQFDKLCLFVLRELYLINFVAQKGPPGLNFENHGSINGILDLVQEGLPNIFDVALCFTVNSSYK